MTWLYSVPTFIKIVHKIISELSLEITNNSRGILTERNILVVTREPADGEINCYVNG
jgi:hypothetical protein